MCGLAGEVCLGGGRPDVGAIERMTAALAARGPDGLGYWVDEWVGLGHRRLSIVDLSEGGAQPMVDDARGLAVVFNGCIYNHEDLRRELGDHFCFRTTSDTEVILAAYARWGEDFVDHLVGMFAIVLVDRLRQQVVLARDRLGIKPLYLARSNGRLRFASTLPALLAGGGVDTSIDGAALHHYLSWHSIVPAPRTILAGVRKLPAATIRVIGVTGQIRDRVYWRPEYCRRPEFACWGEREWADALHDALVTAVSRRMVGDVPVGVLLSGGLDSSLIVALLAEAGHTAVPTFSIGFEGVGEEPGDEFEYSDAVARAFDTAHHRLHIPNCRLAPAVEDAVTAMSEPMGSHDVSAFYLLSREVSRHVKVVQSGQGADEVFAGYAYHRAAAGVTRGMELKALGDAFSDGGDQHVRELALRSRLPAKDVSSQLLARHLEAPGADTALDAVLRLDTHLLMADDPLKRVDSMTMVWGLEARVPFLDQDVVALAAACPPELKIRDGGKGILKSIARRCLPACVVDRPKGDFPVPAVTRLSGPVLTLVRETMTSPEARGRELLDRRTVETLLRAPNSRINPRGGNLLWQLAILELWLQRFGL